MSSRRRLPRSLLQQLLAWLLVPLIALLAANAVLGYRSALETASEAYDRLLLASVRAIADRVAVENGEITVDLPYVSLELFESNIQGRIFYRVTGPNGKTITGYDDLPLPPGQTGPNQSVFYRGQYHGEGIYLAAMNKPLYDPDIPGAVLIAVGETSETRQALSQRILLDQLRREGMLILVAALVVWIGLKIGLRPLMRVRERISARAATDVTPIDDGEVQTEVRPLIQAINQHTGRIEQLLGARQRFLADASHQVRTPLAVLRTQIEYGMRQQDPAAMHAVFADLHHTSEQTAHLINQLLALARAEPNAVTGQAMAEVDLCELARATAIEWVPVARKKHIDLGFEGPDAGITVHGDKLLLHELIANLIDNAIRYSPPAARVTVRVAQSGEGVQLEVEDNGPGIPVSERERVFERFYRGVNADADGSGLGLAIARDVCTAHGAAIQLSEPEGGKGLLMGVRFAANAASA
jgi:two-component system sensor histidine kinase TctE